MPPEHEAFHAVYEVPILRMHRDALIVCHQSSLRDPYKALEYLTEDLYSLLQYELFLWIQVVFSRLIFQKLSIRQSLKAAFEWK